VSIGSVLKVGCTVPVLITILSFLLLPRDAQALSLISSDCSGDYVFKDVYLDNEPVCAWGGAPGGFAFGAPAKVCVVPVGGGTGSDVTPGGCNSVAPLTQLWERFLWLPDPWTVPGTYQILIENNQLAQLRVTIWIQSSGGAPPTVDVDAIKAGAAAQVGSWTYVDHWAQWIDEQHASITLIFGGGSYVGFGLALIGIPTTYNGFVLAIGSRLISSMARQQMTRYAALRDDPPDPLFTEFVAVDIAAINADLAALAPLNPLVPLHYPFGHLTQQDFATSSTVRLSVYAGFTATRLEEKALRSRMRLAKVDATGIP